jgi:hypothetical protein
VPLATIVEALYRILRVVDFTVGASVLGLLFLVL